MKQGKLRSCVMLNWCDTVSIAATKASSQPSECQLLFFGRNIGQLTPNIIYFHYLKKRFLDQSIQKIFI